MDRGSCSTQTLSLSPPSPLLQALRTSQKSNPDSSPDLQKPHIRRLPFISSSISLPSFKVSEANEVKDVCRILREDCSWSPRLEHALSALLPKLQTRILARILKQLRDPDLAWKLFRWAERQPFFMHDEYTFYALIEVLGKARELQSIWAVTDEMRIAGFKIKPIPFTILISSYGRVGMMREAEMALHSMQNAASWMYS